MNPTPPTINTPLNLENSRFSWNSGNYAYGSGVGGGGGGGEHYMLI